MTQQVMSSDGDKPQLTQPCSPGEEGAGTCVLTSWVLAKDWHMFSRDQRPALWRKVLYAMGTQKAHGEYITEDVGIDTGFPILHRGWQ